MSVFQEIKKIVKTALEKNPDWNHPDHLPRLLADVDAAHTVAFWYNQKNGYMHLCLDMEGINIWGDDFVFKHKDPHAVNDYLVAEREIVQMCVVSGELPMGNRIEKCNMSMIAMIAPGHSHLKWREGSVTVVYPVRVGTPREYDLIIDHPV